MEHRYHLYGANDFGTNEMRRLLQAARIPFEFCDIRVHRGGRDHLAYLGKRSIRTIPAVFSPDWKHLGDFDQTLAALNIDPARLPAPEPSVA
jgi:hypothetical protein